MRLDARTILVSGASGYIGLELIKQLLTRTEDRVIALTSNAKKIQNSVEDLQSEDRIAFFDRADVSSGAIPWQDIDLVIHLAFARKQFPQSELIDSLVFSKELFLQTRNAKVPALINISSQGIYGSAPGLHNEESVPCPLDFYSLAKCANEVVLDAVFKGCTATETTSIRLDSIAGNKNLIPTLVRQGIEEKNMKLSGGEQVFSLLDVRDAAAGILALCKVDPAKWERAYNLGWNDRTYDLVEVANMTKAQLEKHGISGVTISLEKRDIKTYAGMDTTKLTALTGWRPRYTITDIIDAVIADYFAGKGKKA